ncbi:hypothetical protein ABQF35_05140 [Mycobacterium syngnathidarum]
MGENEIGVDGMTTMADEEQDDVVGDTSPAASGDVAERAKGAQAANEPSGERVRPLPKAPRRLSVGLKTLAVAVLVIALAASTSVLMWLYIDARTELSDQAKLAENSNRAEQIALDYAVGAAQLDASDLESWRHRLVKGTSDDLSKKLGEAAKSMEQIVVPLQWSSTAQPLIAKVRSVKDNIYIVDTFVGVVTRTVQTKEGLPSTAAYNVTIDGGHDWKITDVGGIGAMVAGK